ncbi:uncharacterized protein PV09_05336 [Verruconis gallopava]|uniref:TLC domain-containing protein n=1 Tax=Verruconis gallopava TaxID=253628 RepID=A0A0D1XMA0_9PEZI|nr:uncharacterized protein PV09_05336 [Verruconis gallopava]KIW03581.1 hypothetical protein PV09_05336 [Verruconis gallopava]
MSMATGSEASPSLAAEPKPNGSADGTRRRRTSSLRGEPPGDTSVPALATMYDHEPLPAQVSSPVQKSNPERAHRGRKRRKVKSLYRRWKSISLRHTWLNPLIICLVVVALYLVNPSEDNPLHSALFLSYPLPRKQGEPADAPLQYGKGARDFAFVGFYTIVLTFTREFTMQRILRPLAIRAGMKTRGKQARFMEQAYTAIYFGFLGPLGLYVMKKTPVWYFNTDGMYEGFPHRSHLAEVKTYYLFQAAYWAQQMIVLMLAQEKPRKDFKELVAHHIITISLIYLSYAFHFTYMGLAVYTTHDISDFFLATSKILNYMESPIVIPYFIIFLCSWAYLRHFINLRILFSLLPLPMPFPDPINEQILSVLSTFTSYGSSVVAALAPVTAPIVNFASTIFPETVSLLQSIPDRTTTYFNTPSDFATVGPYELNWETQQYKCWISQYITFGLLLALQLVNMFWFYLILRILWRLVASGFKETDDVRSEDSEVDAAEREVTLDELRKEQSDAWAGETGADIRAASDSKPQVLVNGVPVDKANGEAR